jgi:hypothetical protein
MKIQKIEHITVIAAVILLASCRPSKDPVPPTPPALLKQIHRQGLLFDVAGGRD